MRGNKLVIVVVSMSDSKLDAYLGRNPLTIQKTAMLIVVMTMAVPHFSLVTIF